MNKYQLSVNGVDISYCSGTARRVADVLQSWTRVDWRTCRGGVPYNATIVTLRKMAEIYAEQQGYGAYDVSIELVE